MKKFSQSDTLHRLIKEAIDSGRAATIEQAEAQYRSFHVRLDLGDDAAETSTGQAALLTAVTLARRTFLGGVSVSGMLDAPNLTPLPVGKTVRDAVSALGGTVVHEHLTAAPLVSIGAGMAETSSSFHVRVRIEGWRAGIVPARHGSQPVAPTAIPPAAALAAALAVSETFFFLRDDDNVAGQRPLGISLWRSGGDVNWLDPDASEPVLEVLPSHLWLVGLGHLGQAFLWVLGLLDYPDLGLELVLQDVDVITPSTESTSILTEKSMVGTLKTRAMAAWAERRGFRAAIHERLFDDSFSRQPNEPAIVLCGLDNALGRRALDKVGFQLAVEAGLGRTFKNFHSLRIHTLPGTRSAADLWPVGSAEVDVSDRAAYRQLVKTGKLDQCGATQLAGKAVGAPFVGCTAAALSVSEILRLLHGGALNQVIDFDLKSPEQYIAVRQPRRLSAFNPGFVRVRDGK